MNREEMIEEAATTLRLYGYGHLADGIETVFESAQTPTDDERALIEKIAEPIIDEAMGDYGSGSYKENSLADALIAAGLGFRRPVSPEPSTEEEYSE